MEPERLTSEATPVVDQADIERQKVVIGDLIKLSADELNNLNNLNLAECDKMIKELMDFIANPTKDALITDVLCQITLLHQQRSQLKAKQFLQLQVEHQMVLDNVSAAKLELSETEVRMEEADAETKDLKAPDVSEAASHQRSEFSTPQVISSHDQPQQVESLQELESQNSSAVSNTASRTEPVLPKFRTEPLNFEFTGSTSTASMGDAGSQTVHNEAVLHSAAVDSLKECQVNNSADTGGSDWRDEQTSHLTRFRQLEYLAQDIEQFDPDNHDSNIHNYLQEVECCLFDLPFPSSREKLKLIWKTTARSVHVFIKAPPPEIRDSYSLA
ncbi:uncharacterized protein LOC118563974 [Fundulus heteroclitus]|uniref:uncharacterized protein LOC118563974 n=1 Tax=Fundulus heteroclitus TaxID=8078 RepID=UPI00165B85C8|nr:uncharacterized protein LOC118563974 [Fundulus heteroclitus]